MPCDADVALSLKWIHTLDDEFVLFFGIVTNMATAEQALDG